MTDSVEIVFPGKYDASGQRTALPRREVALRPRASYGKAPLGPEGPLDRGSLANTLVLGDNALVLDALRESLRGAIDLVVIDPPFGSGGRYNVTTKVGDDDPDAALACGHPPGHPPRSPLESGPASGPRDVRTLAYSDAFEGGLGGFLAMLDLRLRLIHELLASHGSLYVHLDPTSAPAVRLLLDEIFGAQCFQREIVWRIGWVSGYKSAAKNWIRNHDTILFYTKDPTRFTFNKAYIPHPEGYVRRDGKPPRGRGVPIDDVWNATEAEACLSGRSSLDSIQIKSFSREKTGYQTQKNESLLERIIAASSDPGDLVADFFCGSGTTLVVAHQLGRRFVGADVSAQAVRIATRRLVQHGACFQTYDVSDAEFRFGDRPTGAPESDGEARSFRRRVLEAHGAEDSLEDESRVGRDPSSSPTVFARKGSARVAVFGPDACIGDEVWARLRAEARDRGFSELHVLAPRWSCAPDEDPPAGVSANDEAEARGSTRPKKPVARLPVLRRFLVRRELVDPRARAAGLPWVVERPRVAVELTAVPGGLEVTLLRYEVVPDPRDPYARAVRTFTDWVDGWGAGWFVDGGFEVETSVVREPPSQRLSRVARLAWGDRPGREPVLMVEFADVRGFEVRLAFRLRRAPEGGFEVVRTWEGEADEASVVRFGRPG